MFKNIFGSLFGKSLDTRAMSTIVHQVDTPHTKATFGMGCFWANDSLFGATQGVLRTKVGYSGGTTVDPVYRKIQQQADAASGTPTDTDNFRGDHTEVIEIHYDPTKITYQDLLRLFWNNHEYGLSAVIKRQYMSLILYHNDEQKTLAEESFKREEKERNQKLQTEIKAAGTFYPAEDYHQKYRLQGHGSLSKEIGMTPELLQTSTTAARFNGYLVGVGTVEDFEKDAVTYKWPSGVADYVRKEHKKNEGGGLYC